VIANFNAGVVKIYNATSKLVRFVNNNDFLLIKKYVQAYYSAGAEVVKFHSSRILSRRRFEKIAQNVARPIFGGNSKWF
jgi:hypothetical protein